MEGKTNVDERGERATLGRASLGKERREGRGGNKGMRGWEARRLGKGIDRPPWGQN